MENVKSLAERIKIANKELLILIKEAGLKQTKSSDEISPEDQKVILAYLKSKRGAEQVKTPKILSLNRSPGAAGATPGKTSVVHKRKKVSAASRSVAELNALHEREIELAMEAKTRKQREEREALIQKEHSDATAQTKAVEEEPTATAQQKQHKVNPPALKSSLSVHGSPVKKDTNATQKSHTVQKKTVKSSGESAPARPSPSSRKRRTSTGSQTPVPPTELVQINEFIRRKKYGQTASAKDALKSSLLNQGFQKPVKSIKKEISVGEHIQVSELAHLLGIKVTALISALMKLGFMATVNQSIDHDTVVLVAAELGHNIVKEEAEDIEKRVSVGEQTHPHPRPPVVTVMGHVDHGKTSLLDYIRSTRVTEQESGGITQHIGAYHVVTDKGKISFLDTPGHAAFTSMRARGALLTDIVILVVACDDKVMPQTVEAIKHAKSAGVPVVVALNKIDKPEADPERLTNELASYELVPEDWGGDVQFVQISALKGQGIDKLLDAVLLQAELLELKAPDQGLAKGTVIESRLDKHRGPLASILVRQGTLNKGDQILVGTCTGRVRAMYDDVGTPLNAAGPSIPVEILGLGEVPEAGDELLVVTDEKAARELVEARHRERRNAKTVSQVKTLEEAFGSMDSEQKALNLVVKADTRGSIEAIKHSISELETDEMKVNLIIAGTGGITKTDVSLAQATGARVVGFHVRADANARSFSEKSGIKISYYSVIYKLIDDIDNFMHGLLDPLFEETILGTAEVRDIFSASKFGEIAGCMVVDGSIFRNKPIRVIRDDTVIYEGELESLRRFKENVEQVRSGTECGIGVKGYKDVRIGDRIEVFDRIEVARKKNKHDKHAV